MAELTKQETSPDCIFGTKTGTKTCKSESTKTSAGTSPLNPCPQCGSKKLWRNGNRYSLFGDKIQRWTCRDCGLRFSDPEDLQKANKEIERIETVETKSLKSKDDKVANRQICANKGAKNLEPEQINIQVPGMNEDAKTKAAIQNAKGQLVQFEAKMLLDGYAKETIRGSVGCLKALLVRNANLDDVESVKKALAAEEAKKELNKKHWSQNRRRNVINAYTLFLAYQNRTWIKPKCTVDAKLPFIPSEAEIDALIAGTHQKLATFLQLLKETAMRSGEAHKIEWINIDRAKLIVTLNKPEKHSKARMFKVSEKLIEMLYNLPKKETTVFPGSPKGMKVTFNKARKRLAKQLANPRLLAIHFHTLRHWKATMLYHETKDPYYVQRFLGHKSLKSTEIYINIEHTIFQAGSNDKFTVKVSSDPNEIADYLADGFEPQCNQGDLIFLRKRI